MTREVGQEWGFTDPNAASAKPMTREEHTKWFGTWQGTSMLAFSIMENLTELYDKPQWELNSE